MSKPSFEDSLTLIDNEINKRRGKWNLTVLAWMDFEDVSQMIRIHLHKKWHLYNAEYPLSPWVNRVISNHIKNIIRNIYGNFCRPCLQCEAAESDDGCAIYTKQCRDCPLYAHWEKSKKSAYDTKLPVSLESHEQEVYNISSDTMDIERAADNLHKKMQEVLKPFEWRVYRYLYIDHKSDDETAKLMGYRTSEQNRAPGYKQLKNIKKKILASAKECLAKGEVDGV